MKKTNSSKSISILSSLLGGLCLCISSGHVVGGSSGVTVSPMLGKYITDDDTGYDDGNFGSIGVGYDFKNPWGVEASYLVSSPEIEGTADEVDVNLARFDVLYYLNDNDFRPYLVGGVGEINFDEDNGIEDSETIANWGLGFKYKVTPVFAVRGDMRVMEGLDSSNTDYLFGIGAVFKFGQSSSPKPAVKAEPEPTPAPAVGPVDSDGDGVVDAEDSCPGTAAGLQVDSRGCELDSDNDGVKDSLDKCPDSEAGSKVDETGCYVVLKESVSVSLNVNFATNSANVVSDSNPDIEKVAEFLRSYPLANVVIEGHTDSLGAAEYNKSLSQRRAQAVADILMNQYQIDSSRVTAVGYGEEQPLVDNSTAENRAKNRRVTAVVSAVSEKVVK